MTCVPNLATFRLLNHLVGWDIDKVEGLVGLNTASGVQLKPLGDSDLAIDESTLSVWLPPSRLAKTCGVCQWYLITPCPPQSRLLVWSSCEPFWSETRQGAYGVLHCGRAIALSPHRIAITDTAVQSIFFFTDQGRRQLGQVPFNQPGAIAYAVWREWLVVDEQAGVLRRLDMAGVDLGPFPASLPPGDVDRLAVDDECRVWVAVRQDDGRLMLWRAGVNDDAFKQTNLRDLRQSFKPSGLEMVTNKGFCFNPNYITDNGKTTGTGDIHEEDKLNHNIKYGPCFSWYGRPVEIQPAVAVSPIYDEQGQLLTMAIDSGIPRCRWHRVQMDADIPTGTTVTIAVSTSEESTPVPQGIAKGDWSGFEAGVPHPADWQETALNSEDFLMQQPAGRYLFLRLRLTGDGFQTPHVQRIRLDFPRETSLNQLPFVYRENPEAEDFSERFLALFDAFLEHVDSAIERQPALLDIGGVPDAVLPWLGRFLDIAMDPAWDAERRRRILMAAPKLYRMRGTVDGMRTAIHLVFDVEPVIQELPLQRPWGAVGEVHLASGARLFGPSNWRFSLGKSRLSQAPIRSFGNPERDPFNALAHRFNVMVPIALDIQSLTRLQQLINAQKPAHTLVTLRTSESNFILGTEIKLGINTTLKPFAPSVLATGEQAIRLDRGTILSSARGKSDQGLRVGHGSTVGVNNELR